MSGPRACCILIDYVFTGIIEETGTVEQIDQRPGSIRLALRVGRTGKGLKPGDSLAVNGCCLTATKMKPAAAPGIKKQRMQVVYFDLLRETWKRTNFQFLRAGSVVNLERPLRAAGRLDGHFVTGHIDGIGRITRIAQVTSKHSSDTAADHVIEVSAPAGVMRYVILKGSIAIDGISLTVARASKSRFRVYIIPHTFSVTNLRSRQAGDAVNLEADLLGKYVERFVRARMGADTQSS